MSVLGDERAAIAAALTGRTVHTFVPDRLVPPAAFIAPANPYLEHRDTDTFRHLTAAWEVWIIQASGTNEKATGQLDTDIEDVITALEAVNFTVERVDEPFMYAVQNANYLAVVITVTTGVTFTN